MTHWPVRLATDLARLSVEKPKSRHRRSDTAIGRFLGPQPTLQPRFGVAADHRRLYPVISRTAASSQYSSSAVITRRVNRMPKASANVSSTNVLPILTSFRHSLAQG